MRSGKTDTNHQFGCKAKTKSGKPCRAAVSEGGRCYFHADPGRASELGRMGGRKNRHYLSDTPSPPVDLNSASAIRSIISNLIQDVYSRRIDPRIATSLTPLLNLQLRAIEASSVERRIARIENALFNEADDEKDRNPAALAAIDCGQFGASVSDGNPLNNQNESAVTS
jgi:general stress protein YciG